jgi:hypothetical protein
MPIAVMGLPALFVVGALTGAFAQTQNIDQDKSAINLFADTCKACHSSPRGLAKNRYSWTLSLYLRQHYTSSSNSAQALAAYLQSVDTPQPKKQPAIRKSQPAAASTVEPALRPPAAVPAR